MEQFTTTTTNNVMQEITTSTMNICLNEQQRTEQCVPSSFSSLWTNQQPRIEQRKIRCGTCHYYKTDKRFMVQYKRGNKLRTRHQCPIPTCNSLSICGYKAGHCEEIKKLRDAARKTKNEARIKLLKERSDARAKTSLEKKFNRLQAKKEKEEKKKKHLFTRARKLSTYLRNIGVEET